MSDGPAVRHDETADILFLSITRDQRERSVVADVSFQLRTGIGNSGWKAFLVNAPEGFEVFGFEVAEDERHAAIVAAHVGEKPNRRKRAHFSTVGRATAAKNRVWGLLSPCSGRNLRRTISIRPLGEERCGTPAHHRRCRRGRGSRAVVRFVFCLQSPQRHRGAALGTVGLCRQRPHSRLVLAQQFTAPRPPALPFPRLRKRPRDHEVQATTSALAMALEPYT